MDKNKNVIVIGSGVAGLAAAIRLSVQGYSVSVYEKNDYPGGKLSAFKTNGFSFDAGPSLFTQPQNIEELFELAGEPMQNYFEYSKVDNICNYFYDNGKIVNANANPILLANEMAEKLGENPETVTKYLKASKALYNNIGKIFLTNSLHKRKTWFSKQILAALKTVKYSYLFKSLNSYNSSKFKTPEAIQLFNRYATYNGSNPYKAPGMLSLIPHLEMNEGVFYPAGGMISITNALYELAKKVGAKFYFNTPVSSIIHNDGKIIGVVVNDKNVFAEIVICNADVFFTYKNLLNNQQKAKQVLKQERSSSAIVFYWGIKKEFADLCLHNIFFSKNYKAEFDCLFKQKTMYTDPTVYINITSKLEKSQAPVGKENWFVMVNAPANCGQNWEHVVQAAKKKVIEKLNNILQTDIEPLIEIEQILDPLQIENQTSSYMGSLYGTSSNSKLAAFVRHPNFNNNIKGLYFCGGTVHPGGGIPLCLHSAKIVSNLIQSKKNNVKEK